MNAASTTLNLAQIYRNPVFSSRAPVESHSELSNALVSHSLRWGKGEVTTSLFKSQIDRISLMILSYGAEVEVTPDAFTDFILVQMPLHGMFEIEVAGKSILVSQGDIAVIAPSHRPRLLWQRDCKQLILKIPGDLADGVLGQPASDDGVTLWRDPLFKLESRLAPLWNSLLRQLLALLPTHDSPPLHPGWRGQFERTAASFLLSHQPSVLAKMSRASDRGDWPNPAASARLEQMERYIRSRMFAPIALADLARAAGVSPRTLNALCHQHRGLAPMVLLRNMRLEAARERLANSPVSVTEVAMEHGFGHLGRFSAYYRERFGELPRLTGRLF